MPIPVEIESRSPVDASVIFLHGLGADASDLLPVVAGLGLGREHAIRFVLPNAPERAVTINGGMVMPAWYDILDQDIAARPDEPGIRASALRLVRLIDRECERGIAAGRIVVAGFSQGGAIALVTGLRYPRRLAGLVALSSYLPLAGSLAREATEVNRGVPIFMGHGTFDPVVPFSHGSRACRLLEKMGYAAEFCGYRMEHALCPEEISDVGDWLRQVLARSPMPMR